MTFSSSTGPFGTKEVPATLEVGDIFTPSYTFLNDVDHNEIITIFYIIWIPIYRFTYNITLFYNY